MKQLSDLFKSFGMETGQVFVLTVLALAYFHEKGANDRMLDRIALLGLAFIVGEKLLSAVKAWREPPSKS